MASFPYFSDVQRAYQELVAAGHIIELPPGNQQAVEDQKGLITRRGAYYANIQDSNYGILEKTTGNNSHGYSTDIIIHKDGRFWDVASDNGRTAFPIDGGEHNDPNLIPRWRQPTRALAGFDSEPVPIPPDPVPIPPPDTVNAKLDLIIAENRELRTVVDLILARQDTTDAQLNDARRMLREIQLKQSKPYSYSNRFIGGITPVGV